MKKNIHLPTYQIIFRCRSCNQDYQTISTANQNIFVDRCQNCDPFYTGASASEIKIGAVEKYRQRAQKVKSKNQG